MIGTILTKEDVKKLRLKPMYANLHVIKEPVWRYYKASMFTVLLEEMKGGKFKVIACHPEAELRAML